MRPNIEVHIEELVLHGFAPSDGPAMRTALETELARLLAEKGAPSGLEHGGDMAYASGGSFSVGTRGGIAETANNFALAVYRSMQS